jgi:flagellar hook-basal body complex protein FliE
MSGIPAVSGLSAVPSSALQALQAAQSTSGAGAASVTPASGSSGGFANVLTSAVDAVQSTQETANGLALQAVTGNLDDVAQATIAATRAQLTMELASTVRNKGVDAFNQIMNMQA